jgi:hypothetical protein
LRFLRFYSSENVPNNYCPQQMKGFIEGVQEIEKITRNEVDIQFYDPAYNDVDKAIIESMFYNNGLKLTIFPREFTDSELSMTIENNIPTLIISFIGSYGYFISTKNLVSLECSCGHGKSDDSFSWVDVLPLMLEKNGTEYKFRCLWDDFVNLSLFELFDLQTRMRNVYWKEIISFQLSFLISQKMYIEFNSNTPKFLEQWKNRESNYLLTNGVTLLQFCVYLENKNFQYTDDDKNVLRNSWALYKRVNNLHS